MAEASYLTQGLHQAPGSNHKEQPGKAPQEPTVVYRLFGPCPRQRKHTETPEEQQSQYAAHQGFAQ